MNPLPQDANPTYGEKVKANEWHEASDLQQILSVIRDIGELPSKGWHWTMSRSWRCKYIDLRIDMRDGGFILKDRNGTRISLDELRNQTTSEETPNE